MMDGLSFRVHLEDDESGLHPARSIPGRADRPRPHVVELKSLKGLKCTHYGLLLLLDLSTNLFHTNDQYVLHTLLILHGLGFLIT